MLKNILVLTVILFLVQCQSTGKKGLEKDIIGINEQLYNLEKRQIAQANLLNEYRDKLEKPGNPVSASVQHLNDAGIEKAYQDGYNFYLQQNYQKAVETMLPLVQYYRPHHLIDNACYWLAEGYLKLNDQEKAIHFFQTVVTSFPFGNKADAALFKIGTIFGERKEYSQALLAFNRLLADYSQSEFVQAVRDRVSKINKLLRRKT